MNFLKINNGKVEVRSESGSLIRVVSSDAISANFNLDQSLILITTYKGKVELRKDNGSLVRTIGNNDAIDASWNVDEIIIITKKGKIETRKDNGSLIKTI